MNIPEIKETQRQGIVVKENETEQERDERLGKLEKIWSEGVKRSRQNECSFFQGLLNEEYKKKGKQAPNLYPDVFPNGVTSDMDNLTYKPNPAQ